MEEEKTKEQPRQEERRNVPDQGEPHPSQEVGAEGMEKEVMDEEPRQKPEKKEDGNKMQHPTEVGIHV